MSSTDRGRTGGGGEGEGEGEGVGGSRVCAGQPNNPAVQWEAAAAGCWLYNEYWVCQKGAGRPVGCWTVTILGIRTNRGRWGGEVGEEQCSGLFKLRLLHTKLALHYTSQ